MPVISWDRVGSWLRAMIGIRNKPANEEDLVATLIENGLVEARAMAAWVLPWGGTLALLLVVGRAVRDWSQPAKNQVLLIAGVPLAIAVAGVILHMLRAGAAVSMGHRLAVRREAGGGYARAIALLTTTTPWILVPQIIVGTLFAVLIRPGQN